MVFGFFLEKEGKNVNKDNALKGSFGYIKAFLKWVVIASALGLFGGTVGSVFHKSIEFVTDFRIEHPWIIFLLPIGGLVISFIYWICRKKGHIDTNRVIEAARSDEKVPLVMAPLIFVSTVITHLLGGSAGREGAALQLGGSIGYNMGKLLRLKKEDTHSIVMAGMSSVFSALFGTPITAAVFSLEVVSVGIFHYAGLLPCIISAFVAYRVSLWFGSVPTHFDFVNLQPPEFHIMTKAIILAILCAIVSIAFCVSIKKCEKFAKRFCPNKFLRAFLGGAIIVVLTVLVGTYDYNGAGMKVIERALGGTASPWAFILKIIFTSITIAAGFKGGEIVPTFFIGATFGCFAGGLLGLDAGFGAAIGFVAMFCGVVNCPIASIILALEAFGSESIVVFAAVCAVSFMMSGYFGLYKSQRIVYSKLTEEYVDKKTK
ncbi:MAG: chloride channel protein [Clostridia bacterium]|nr:chloride channel protein [Clostridia bacterium]